jgi:hypothetical protein
MSQAALNIADVCSFRTNLGLDRSADYVVIEYEQHRMMVPILRQASLR